MTSSLPRRPGVDQRARVVEHRGGQWHRREDRLAVEEPLEIRLDAPGLPPRRVGVTMRTPGNDFELAVGWLVHERVIAAGTVRGVRYCTDAELRPEQEFNVVTVAIDTAPLSLPGARLVTSACGVCGADTVAEVLDRTAPPPAPVLVAPEVVHCLPGLLRAAQPGFARTGGLHAAGLFETDGTLVVAREDVGRHNAVDKVVGARLLAGRPVPPVLVLSGRIGFELVQKAVVSGIAVLVAVGAPSTLAVRLAQDAGIGLAGFTGPERFVAYATQACFGV